MERTVNGVVDYMCDMMEEVGGDKDVSMERKAGLISTLSKEVRGFMSLNLSYKKLMAQSPDIARADTPLRLGSGTHESPDSTSGQ